jgi:leucyl-tRNA synthetase
MEEETGYRNIKSIRKIGGEIHNSFYAEHKGVNRYAESVCYFIELSDGARSKEDEIDAEHHRGEWVESEDISSFINLLSHKWFWDIYKNGESAFTDIDQGKMINSEFLDGLVPAEAIGKMTSWLEEKGVGKKAINYKLRDWVFSRQRYWGEPIPLVHCAKCGIVPLKEKDLPLTLPEVEKYEPTGTGESPLATIDEWVNTTCPQCDGPAKRETNTMPQWAGSSWYWLRYIDPHNDKELADQKKLKYWLPVDLYLGGAEHAVLHLLYARFWNMVLYDIGAVPAEEPFAKLVNQGLILGEDGEKMSKSRGNVINPDDILAVHGADAFRMYEMFMGPLEQMKPWSMQGIIGIDRFLDKVWGLFQDTRHKIQDTKNSNAELEILLNKTIKKVGEDIEKMSFNTAISAMMILINKFNEVAEVTKESLEKFLIILAPFAPHLAEELWSKLGNKKSIFVQSWPEYDESKIKDETIELPVQINGKVRAKLKLPADISEENAVAAAKADENVAKYLQGQTIKKVIFIKGKMLSFVV